MSLWPQWGAEGADQRVGLHDPLGWGRDLLLGLLMLAGTPKCRALTAVGRKGSDKPWRR